MLSIFAELVLGVKNHQSENSNLKLYTELINIVDGSDKLSRPDQSRSSCPSWGTRRRRTRS